MCLPGKHEVKVSPQNPQKEVRCGGAHVPQHWGGSDRKIPGTPWPACLAQPVSSGFSERHFLKRKEGEQ